MLLNSTMLVGKTNSVAVYYYVYCCCITFPMHVVRVFLPLTLSFNDFHICLRKRWWHDVVLETEKESKKMKRDWTPHIGEQRETCVILQSPRPANLCMIEPNVNIRNWTAKSSDNRFCESSDAITHHIRKIEIKTKNYI